MQMSPVQPSLMTRSSVPCSWVRASCGMCSSLLNEARVNLGMLAEVIKSSDSNTVYTITGYSDAGTGSKKRNEQLSKERAQAVFDCLTKEFGVSASQLRMDYKGGVDNMFYDDPRLSRAVITRGE